MERRRNETKGKAYYWSKSIVSRVVRLLDRRNEHRDNWKLLQNTIRRYAASGTSLEYTNDYIMLLYCVRSLMIIFCVQRKKMVINSITLIIILSDNSDSHITIIYT